MTAVESRVQGLHNFQLRSFNNRLRMNDNMNFPSKLGTSSHHNVPSRNNTINNPFNIFPNQSNVQQDFEPDHQRNQSYMRRTSRKLSFPQHTAKFEHHYLYHETMQRNGFIESKQTPSKLRYGSTASDSDSTASHSSSELSGFKIVQKGKIVHDETEEELESLCRSSFTQVRFASSEYELAPSAKSISLPSFTDLDSEDD